MIAKYAFGRESNYLHTGTWNWAKIRPWLVEGAHHMHRLAREKLVPLGNWLIANNIDEFDPHASITLEKAVELIQMFWGRDKIAFFVVALKPHHPPKKWFLLLLASPD